MASKTPPPRLGRGLAALLGDVALAPNQERDPVRSTIAIDRIAPNANKEVQALITPTEKAIAGDYVTAIRASTRGESASASFRVSVATSLAWGFAGVGVIAAALLVMVAAIARFGRR